jgi:hypothetical protein
LIPVSIHLALYILHIEKSLHWLSVIRRLVAEG